ncbi:hypothetical protein WJX72_008042 [[Myrmecia] bisecta]|uniref:MIF4G domain-containing protein n=1 Tax=[Myrmecia] bisecta TaxID=41462 RepID=A0AAW1Q7R3_9CHLO
MALDLVPIRLHLQAEGRVVQDSFCWNAQASEQEVQQFAAQFCREQQLADRCIAQVVKAITGQVAAYTTAAATAHSTAGERLELIKLDMHLGDTLLQDQFVWDVHNRDADPEAFATCLCRDLGLQAAFATLIAVEIREQVLKHLKTAAKTGSIGPVSPEKVPRRSTKAKRSHAAKGGQPAVASVMVSGVVRKRDEQEAYTPVVRTLTASELRERELRAVKGQKGRYCAWSEVRTAEVPLSQQDLDQALHAVSGVGEHNGIVRGLVQRGACVNSMSVGKVLFDDREEGRKQKEIELLLNKVTAKEFDKIFDQMMAVVGIAAPHTLRGFVNQVFDKALTEPTCGEIYAKLCFKLDKELPDFEDDSELELEDCRPCQPLTLRRLLVNKCQEEFEYGRAAMAAVNAHEKGEGELAAHDKLRLQREEAELKGRQRMLGNIQFIGQMYKHNMLTERIMHTLIRRLLGETDNPKREDVECLCKLLSTVGRQLDESKRGGKGQARQHMDGYFECIQRLAQSPKLALCMRSLLQDTIELRQAQWVEPRTVDGPTTIKEIHTDAHSELNMQRLPGGDCLGPRETFPPRRLLGVSNDSKAGLIVEERATSNGHIALHTHWQSTRLPANNKLLHVAAYSPPPKCMNRNMQTIEYEVELAG